MKNGVRMENMGEKISAVIASFVLAGCAGQRPQPEDPSLLTPQARVLEFLVDIQERNFRKSVVFCDDHNAKVNAAFSHYLQQYRQGTRSGLEKVGQKESLNLIPGEGETKTFLDMQDRQGDNLLQRISTSPDHGCGKLLSIFSALSAEDAENQLLVIYAAYLDDRKKYCSKIPRPDGCA